VSTDFRATTVLIKTFLKTLTSNVSQTQTLKNFAEQVTSMNRNMKRNRYRNYLLGLISLSMISAVAVADPGHGRGASGRFMMFFDANHDNMVTIEELNTAAKERFEKMDADGNGAVTMDEFQAYIRARKAEHQQKYFSNIDSNSDGNLSKEEFIQYREKMAEQRFQNLDANNDGMVSKDEFLAHKRGFRGGKFAHRGKCGPHGHGHGGGRFFSRMDSNHDGQLSLDETLAAWTKWFNRIDANHDQVVTADEVKAFREKMMGR
jgi:Ca2+-binding EF-hand superfamily protein